MKKNPGRKQRRFMEKEKHFDCYCKKYNSQYVRLMAFANADLSMNQYLKHDFGIIRIKKKSGFVSKMIKGFTKLFRKQRNARRK